MFHSPLQFCFSLNCSVAGQGELGLEPVLGTLSFTLTNQEVSFCLCLCAYDLYMSENDNLA